MFSWFQAMWAVHGSLSRNGSPQKAVRQKPRKNTATMYSTARRRRWINSRPGAMTTSAIVVTMCESTRHIRMSPFTAKSQS